MNVRSFKMLCLFLWLCPFLCVGQAPEGYDLWLRYDRIKDVGKLETYRNAVSKIYFHSTSDMLQTARLELTRGLSGMLGVAPIYTLAIDSDTQMIIALRDQLDPSVLGQLPSIRDIDENGFLIQTITYDGHKRIVLTAADDLGILYGVFRLVHMIRTLQDFDALAVLDAPKVDLRLLNHWDNLDGTVERGYAGSSIWNWHKLPEYIDQRYIDYARANASIGINGVALTNVNANALVLTPLYLEKVAALAEVFRPYGIKVYLTARFSAPIELDGLASADPQNEDVISWWNKKVAEIYTYIPDFGGFLVKANSEGQPGPQNYGRSHVDGANLLARAVAPYDGIVMWRAFVYSEHDPEDRAKQAYAEFLPLDGRFLDNVLVQSKNGPIDFQPREPFHPLFGAMQQTPVMIEFQITQEYLGFSAHLVFLPKLYEEVLQSETYAKGAGSSVADIVKGSLFGNSISGMAGVANIGSDLNWTGHPFAQANWYGFGRLAWDPNLSAELIAEEWLQATYTTDTAFINPVIRLMLDSREAVVNYMNPYGLHHLFATDHHYGPGPWVSTLSRPEWNPTYYHKADSLGIGFDRTPGGSNAVGQYAAPLHAHFGDVQLCPEEYLLWFHHVPWDYQLKNGHTLWDGLALKYQKGIDQVKATVATWDKMKSHLTDQQYQEVAMLLQIQLKEARWWKDACLLYFQTFSNRPIPSGVEMPTKSLDYFKSLRFPFAPGIRPQWD